MSRTIAMAAVLAAAATMAEAQAPTMADVAGCNEKAQLATRGGPSAAPREAPVPERLPPAEPGRTDPTGTVITRSSDPLLEGIAADRIDDPAYREAYRDCMRDRKGAPAR